MRGLRDAAAIEKQSGLLFLREHVLNSRKSTSESQNGNGEGLSLRFCVSARKSTTSICGISRAFTRSAMVCNSYFPVSTLFHDSSEGVAEPRTMGIFKHLANTIAASRA